MNPSDTARSRRRAAKGSQSPEQIAQMKITPSESAFSVGEIQSLSIAIDSVTERVEEMNNSRSAAIRGAHSPMARAENEVGRLPAGTQFQGMTIVFSPFPAPERNGGVRE
jgi:hypothetical protein